MDTPHYTHYLHATFDGLISKSDVAKLLGISRQGVDSLLANREKNGFPDSAGTYSRGSALSPLFKQSEVEEWHRPRLPLEV